MLKKTIKIHQFRSYGEKILSKSCEYVLFMPPFILGAKKAEDLFSQCDAVHLKNQSINGCLGPGVKSRINCIKLAQIKHGVETDLEEILSHREKIM